MELDRAAARVLGMAVREARHSAGLSLRKLAERCGAARTTLFRLELGESQVVSAETLDRIAREVGIDPVDTLCSVGRLPPTVIDYLVARPDLVRRLDRHAREAAQEGA